ncbi:MAG TPA: hypothetical protein VFH77_01975 [Streptomyces sp.]|nr:hypothetical protein [Streptomyces sp.]
MSEHPPQQPGPVGPPTAPWGTPPPQPPQKKGGAGKAFGFGCLGVLALFLVIGMIAAVAGGGDGGGDDVASGKPAASAQPKDDAPQEQAADDTAKPAEAPKEAKPKQEAPKEEKPKKKEEVTKAVFKVWGTAPNGVDTTYGSDSENLQGSSGAMTKTLTLKDDALYYAITAQLQGGGDIHCSVTIGDKTKEGHAVGGYNICSAQLNSGLFGGWD